MTRTDPDHPVRNDQPQRGQEKAQKSSEIWSGVVRGLYKEYGLL